MNAKRIAIFYQCNAPPPAATVKKSQKPDGYSDSGADISFNLKGSGANVITPVDHPHAETVMDWIFPDNPEGYRNALERGANVFWLNTVLYKGHPVEAFRGKGLRVVGQDPKQVQKYDDKFLTQSTAARSWIAGREFNRPES